MFGRDGTLIANSGDGAAWDHADVGGNPECAQMFGAHQDIGARRAQSLNSLAGKIVRIDPMTGAGIGSTTHAGLIPNPHFDPGAPSSPRSRIWAIGFRNNYRSAIRPDSNVEGPGVIYTGDVGWSDWEELDVVRTSGGNYGWPCWEGPTYQPAYFNAVPDPQWCRTLVANPTNRYVAPLLFYHNRSPNPSGVDPLGRPYSYDVGFVGNTIIGGPAFYTGNRYPARYRGGSSSRAAFFADYGTRLIRVFWVDANDRFIENNGLLTFATGLGPVVALKAHPVDSDIYYVDLTGAVRRFVYTAASDGPQNDARFVRTHRRSVRER